MAGLRFAIKAATRPALDDSSAGEAQGGEAQGGGAQREGAQGAGGNSAARDGRAVTAVAADDADVDGAPGTGPVAPLLAPIVAARWLTSHGPAGAPTSEHTNGHANGRANRSATGHAVGTASVGGRAGWLAGAAALAAAESRRVLHLELDVSRLPPSCGLEPGDALAVMPENDPIDVAELCASQAE